MSSKLLEQHDSSTNQARHWDQPQGVGWQLWRRTHATALSGKQLQRHALRFRIPTLMRHSLLMDIYERWGVGQSPAVTRFYSDLPLFWIRASLFSTGEPPEQSSSPHNELHRSVDAHPVSSLSEMAYLSRESNPSPAMTTEGTRQRLSRAGAALMWRRHNLPTPQHAQRLPWNRPRSHSFGNPAGLAPDSNNGAFSEVEPFLEPGGPQSEQQVVRRSPLVSDPINSKSDIRASQPTAASPEAQQNQLVRSLLRHRDVPVLQNLMLRRGVEQNVHYPLLNGKSRLSSSAMRQRSGGTPRYSYRSEIQQAETPMSVAFDVSRSAYWSASRFYPVTHGDVAVARLTPSLGGTEVSLRRYVGAVEQQRTIVQRLPVTPLRPREEEWGTVPSPQLLFTKSVPVARNVTGYREPLAQRVADDSHTRPVMFSRTGQSVISFAQEKALLYGQDSLRAQSPQDNEMVAGVLRRALGTRLATAVRPPSGQFPYTGYDTGKVTSQRRASLTVMSAAQGNSRLSRASDHGDIVLRRLSDPGAKAGAETDNFTASSIGMMAVAQPPPHHETYLHRYENRTPAITNFFFLAGRGVQAGEREVSVPPGMVRRFAPSTIAPHTVQTYVVNPGKRNSNRGLENNSIDEPLRGYDSGVIVSRRPRESGSSWSSRHSGFRTVSRLADPEYHVLALALVNSHRRGFAEGPSAIPRVAGSLAVSSAIDRWRAPHVLADHLTASNTLQAMPLKQTRPFLGITASPAGEDPGPIQRAVSLFSGLMATRPGAPVSIPSLRRLHDQLERSQQASAMMLRDAAPDLPLAHSLRPENQDSLTARRSTNSSIIQTRPQPAATTTGSAAMLVSTGNGQGPGMRQAQTNASQALIDLDELVEKAWLKLMRKFAIEQERRGYIR